MIPMFEVLSDALVLIYIKYLFIFRTTLEASKYPPHIILSPYSTSR